jgi:hypothetical protein
VRKCETNKRKNTKNNHKKELMINHVCINKDRSQVASVKKRFIKDLPTDKTRREK